MPRKKITSIISQLKLGESYTSLILGVIVVVVASILFIAFVRSRNVGFGPAKPETASQKTEKESGVKEATYTVVAGDTLWSISEKMYKSGYNWMDIAKANKLANPDIIEAGTKLTIPKVEPKLLTTNATDNVLPANSITGSTYTVKKGDFLWEIAVRAYGDGFAWVKIAQANNLANPDLIFEGNNLTIPR